MSEQLFGNVNQAEVEPKKSSADFIRDKSKIMTEIRDLIDFNLFGLSDNKEILEQLEKNYSVKLGQLVQRYVQATRDEHEAATREGDKRLLPLIDKELEFLETIKLAPFARSNMEEITKKIKSDYDLNLLSDHVTSIAREYLNNPKEMAPLLETYNDNLEIMEREATSNIAKIRIQQVQARINAVLDRVQDLTNNAKND